VSSVRELLKLIDVERERAGLSKADLAQRIGTSPATVRRLFTSESANPTLRTMLDLFDALDLELALQPRGTRGSGPTHRQTRTSVKSAAST
jgi:transcriptional regulator with XRE-family HTH domain